MRALAVLLAYEEAASIGRTVAEVARELPSADVLVVDDGSSDGTAEAARAAGARLVRHPFNLGVAAAEATGLRWAVRGGYQAVVRLDGDGQHDPASAHALLEAVAGGAELAVGTRFSGIESFRSTPLRRAGNRLLSGVVSALCGLRLTDPTSGFRAFGGRALPFFAETFPHDYPEPESLLWACRRGFRVQELPVRMRPRTAGESSLSPLGSAYYMVKVSLALGLELLRATPAPPAASRPP
ncbi:MAG: glycosyltransferase family 2 protein [Myxococcales bacterium]